MKSELRLTTRYICQVKQQIHRFFSAAMRDATDTQLGDPCCCHPGRLEGLRHAPCPGGMPLPQAPWWHVFTVGEHAGERGPGGGGICSSHLACSCIWQISFGFGRKTSKLTEKELSPLELDGVMHGNSSFHSCSEAVFQG